MLATGLHPAFMHTRWLRAKLRLLRPVVETGFESLLLLRLCAEEALASGPAKRPLTIGEITTNWGPELRDTLLARYEIRQEEAIEAFGSTREAWLDEDEAGWLAANSFYDGALGALRATLAAEGGAKVYIVTTKQAKFASRLLSSQKIDVQDEYIFGLGSGTKADMLFTLRQRHPEATLRFVEDKAETIRSVANDPRLFSLGLYFAEWGYSTPEQAALAASMPRVHILANAEDLATALELDG